MQSLYINNLPGCALSKTLSEELSQYSGQAIIITPNTVSAQQLAQELMFFDPSLTTHYFPDLETLAYDTLSPHQSVISERIECLARLLKGTPQRIVTSIKTLFNYLPPTHFFSKHHLSFKCGDTLDHSLFKQQCIEAGYTVVSKVMEPGECAFRGSIIDLFPMGMKWPLRIDLFDNEIESIRTFDVDTQRSLEKRENIHLLPAHEFPIDETAITLFRKQWRNRFLNKPNICPIYNEISEGIIPSGIEYYLPLFFEKTATFFDYLGNDCKLFLVNDIHTSANQHINDIHIRYHQRSSDVTRPILPVEDLFLNVDQLFHRLKGFDRIVLNETPKAKHNAPVTAGADLAIDRNAAQPLHRLKNYLANHTSTNTLIVAESQGRREVLINLLQQIPIHCQVVEGWKNFIDLKPAVAICYGPLAMGCEFPQENILVITEAQFFGKHIIHQKRQRSFDPDVIIRSLTELQLNAPIVHIEHGVGRYKGLQVMTTKQQQNEFVVIEYADKAKIYVPITSLHLISRYSGGNNDHAPLHRLGSEEWQKQKEQAEKQITDVAVELLDTYAKREAQKGFAFEPPNEDYAAFVSQFPFHETDDQCRAIDDIINDMTSERPMDRLVCGDVGFGKTEVAMRAAFLAVQNHKQVCVLVPTTLLATQHHENFLDRFAEFPVTIEVLSRFRTKKETDKVLTSLKQGTVDIVVGTHKLFQKNIEFKNLGLLIIDEEHRFGVKQKEHIKALKENIDILSLTATPIPRTLNMAMSGIRDISIIATPPAKRLAIKTFCHEKNPIIIKEAVLREILRGGQVFFLHNDVDTITHIAMELNTLIPEAKIEIAHGQMRERQLERIMSDFYHHKFNVLICTTIIETGIDVPTANTIIINRADKFGLAQLHQLRGRVGRGHHQAYAYLLTPNPKSLTKDAQKRLEALLSLEDLGAGFTLATHDLEIRGAGEFLGEEQSGHVHSLGFSLYMELLERAVRDLKSGKQPVLNQPLHHGTEINIPFATIIPESYLPDIHTRLIFYKRISNAKNNEELQDLQVEMIDRFGLLPPSVKNLFKVSTLKLKAQALGIVKISLSYSQGMVEFAEHTNVDPATIIRLIQVHAARYKLKNSIQLLFDLKEKEDVFEALECTLTDLAGKAVIAQVQI